MNLTRADADVFVPRSGTSPQAALKSVTHLCIAAHQDDIEVMAFAGICDCLDARDRRGFGGVVVTGGAGSPRSGPYAAMTDAEMQAVRRREQRRAAELGDYAIQLQLAHSSAEVKQPAYAGVAADLDAILASCRPEVVFLHNPADKHDTHIAVLHRCLEALRRLPPDCRPARVLGCEVWRDLDWLIDADKVPLDAGRRPELALALLKVFDSQIAGGKRYDLATLGRRNANATFHTSHATDRFAGITWAMDLTPLVADPKLAIDQFVAGFVSRLGADVTARLARFR